MCKFTPLGFETSYVPKVSYDIVGVNLPRWGLKQLLSGVALARASV